MVSYELTQNVEMFHVVESREENLDKDACMCARVPHGSTHPGRCYSMDVMVFTLLMYIMFVRKSYLALGSDVVFLKNCGEDGSRQKLRTHPYIPTINLSMFAPWEVRHPGKNI